MVGTVNIDRGLFEHDLFKNEPFTEREAWMWMIMEAAWKPRTKRVGNGVFQLERGQLVSSVRFMAEAWKWSKSRVDRYLNRVSEMKMICVKSGTAASVITICNYDKFQNVPSSTGTPAGHQRDTSGTNEKKGVIKKEKNIGDFGAFWSVVPKKVGKDRAAVAYEKALEKTDAETLINGMMAYAAERDGKDAQYTAHPAKWLSDGRWSDAPQAKAKTKNDDNPNPGELREFPDGWRRFTKLREWELVNV